MSLPVRLVDPIRSPRERAQPARLVEIPYVPDTTVHETIPFPGREPSRAAVDRLAEALSRDGVAIVRNVLPPADLERVERRVAQIVAACYRGHHLPPLTHSPFGPRRADVDRMTSALVDFDGTGVSLAWIERRLGALPEIQKLFTSREVTAAVRRGLRLAPDQPLSMGIAAVELAASSPAWADDASWARVLPTAEPRAASRERVIGPPPFLRLRVALFDCPLGAGPDAFRPGSHHPANDVEPHSDAALQHELRAGDLVLADPRALARPAPNRSGRVRCLATCDFGDALAEAA